MSELTAIVEQLKQERSRLAGELRQLDQAIEALTNVGIKNGRAVSATQQLGRPRRPMSAAAKRKIAAAQRARWAKWRARKSKVA